MSTMTAAYDPTVSDNQLCQAGLNGPDTSGFAWIRLYESLHTYVANIDLVGDPLQGIYCVRASELLISKCIGYPI